MSKAERAGFATLARLSRWGTKHFRKTFPRQLFFVGMGIRGKTHRNGLLSCLQRVGALIYEPADYKKGTVETLTITPRGEELLQAWAGAKTNSTPPK